MGLKSVLLKDRRVEEDQSFKRLSVYISVKYSIKCKEFFFFQFSSQ